jgi:photosystem II stability/assembly factor-like uncharacterized protein
MKKTFLLLIIFCFSIPLFSQWQFLKAPGSVNAISNVIADDQGLLINIGNNIYQTKDEGKTWVLLNKETDVFFSEVKSIAKIKNKIFVLTYNGLFDNNAGVYSSTNEGIAWEKDNRGIELNQIVENAGGMKFYVHSDELYLTTGQIYKYDFIEEYWYIPIDTSKLKVASTALFVKNDNLLIGKSVDQELIDMGYKWPNIIIYNLKTNEFSSILDTNSGIYKYNINDFLVKDDILFAATSGGVFISNDGGSNWVKKSQVVENDSLLFDYFDTFKLFQSGKIIYALTNSGILFSSNQGESWKQPDPYQVLPGAYYSQVPATDINKLNNKIVVATTDGLYFCTDSISNFMELTKEALNGDMVRDINTSEDNIYSVINYSNYNNNGIWVSEDLGTTWSRINSTNLLGKIAINGNVIFISDYKKNVWISKDKGKNFEMIKEEQGLPKGYILDISIIEGSIYVCSSSGIYISKNSGESWELFSEYFKNNKIKFIKRIDDIFFVYNYNEPNTLYYSLDNGIDWDKITISYEDYLLDFVDIVVRKNKIYAAVNAFYKEGAYNNQKGGYFFSSTDFGKTWKNSSPGLPTQINISSLVNYNEYIFLSFSSPFGYGNGVFYSTLIHSDYAWFSYNNGLTNSYIRELLIKDKYLFAATGGGVYRVRLSDFGIADVDELDKKPDYLWASQPYPIPAQDYVYSEIYFDNNNEIELSGISVYNVMGNKVETKDKIAILPKTE